MNNIKRRAILNKNNKIQIETIEKFGQKNEVIIAKIA
jgi:hypothetical protein